MNNPSLLLDKRRAKWLRFVSFAIVLLGAVVGGGVCYAGLHSRDYMNDPSMLRFDRAEVRQMGVLFGKQGRMIHDMDAALECPTTQAIIIWVVAVILAGGCWYFAWLLDYDGKREN